jgi:hypothetical protein
MRDSPPAEPAQITDERITFPFRDRLAAQQTGPRQEPALHSGEYLADPDGARCRPERSEGT